MVLFHVVFVSESSVLNDAGACRLSFHGLFLRIDPPEKAVLGISLKNKLVVKVEIGRCCEYRCPDIVCKIKQYNQPFNCFNKI